MLEDLIALLEKEDKAGAVQLCLDALAQKQVTVPVLYETVLGPAMARLDTSWLNEADLIWHEHVWTAIIRSIIEQAYPYVMQERQDKGLLTDDAVIVFCPQEEDHDIGARMAADFFLIWGFKVTFIGANTPEKTLLRAIEQIRPRYLSVSIANYFNLVVTSKLISHIKAHYGKDMVILAGGHAVSHRPDALHELGADRLLRTFADIGELRQPPA